MAATTAANEERPIKRVIVVGAGIGGLAAAHALRRRGLEVLVLERAAEFIPTAGAGLGFSPNGQACLESIGFPSAVHAVGHPFLQHVLFSGETILTDSDHLARGKERWGLGVQGALRADLVSLLAEPLQADGVLRYGAAVARVEQPGPDSVTVHLASGEALEADLVVGADGINSTVAAFVDGGDGRDPPVYTGEANFYGTIPYEDFRPPGPEEGGGGEGPAAFLGRRNTLMMAFDRGEFVSYPCGGGADPGQPPKALVWAITYRCPTPPSRRQDEWDDAKAAEAGGGGGGGAPVSNRALVEKMLLDKYGPSHPALHLARQTAEERLLHFGLYYRKVKPRWHRGRVVLLGDSAHATLPYVGQGANQAIEDSVVLARCLAEEGRGFRDAERGLQTYFHRRYARTKRIVDTAVYLGRLTHTEGRLASWLRDAVLRLMVRFDFFYKLAAREMIDYCPVPIAPAAAAAAAAEAEAAAAAAEAREGSPPPSG